MKQGFSMVEMLVVVAIIMLVIALVLPVFTFVTEYAKSVQCMSNMRSIYAGLKGYSTDNRGNMPYYWDEYDRYNNLTATPMWWGYPAVQYLVDFPAENPYTNDVWHNPSDYRDFNNVLEDQFSDIALMFFCPAGDNRYFAGAYEGQRKYISNYYGFFGPDGDISHAIGKRDYQSSDPYGFNRPINCGNDKPGTWLVADFNWSDKSDDRWGVKTAHYNYSRNILHLDGSVILTEPEFWVNSHEWLDRFPER